MTLSIVSKTTDPGPWISALKEVDATVKGMIAIFSYGFDIADENFKDANVELTTLSDYDALIEQATDTNYVSTKEVKTLQNWRSNPSEWNQ